MAVNIETVSRPLIDSSRTSVVRASARNRPPPCMISPHKPRDLKDQREREGFANERKEDRRPSTGRGGTEVKGNG